MAELTDAGVSELLAKPNHAVLSTINKDGSVHSAVVWVNVEEDKVAFNGALGRVWPANIDRDARVTLVVINQENPYEYAEFKGTATAVDGGDGHIDRLAQKYINQDKYPWRAEGEVRQKFSVATERVRYAKA
ncbi:TIGR03618 family F420-dependent PPOX class oxidoreductase [Solirubrobacter phytolaccae]|uniref:TIGR03618 family F420-dependent PPOX class oxidoreductase n=1 Tax=Solirubrobacter phytolaccae TaxID=1404360 RepID=A0A9X3SCT1_9ACTN|nr:TIGR03618 family F420-dependent PPOX class oxidoreductase [Solirubrobacter phytolaccae]MDA0185076.1 TIGR03618 family F420-dependent PPOX class oxidoreductase [Solirubrobacter phytolaccae]